MMLDRICRNPQCNVSFRGGPHAHFCPSCRAERAKKVNADHKQRKRRGLTRAIGSTDICERCNRSYTVDGGLQRFCPECQPKHAAEHDRKKSLSYYHNNKNEINPVRNERRKNMKHERPHLTSVNKCAIQMLYDANITIVQIALLYQITHVTASRYAKGGMVRRTGTSGNKKIDDSVAEEIRYLYKNKKQTYAQLAALYNIQTSTVHYVIKNEFWSRKCLRDGCSKTLARSANEHEKLVDEFCSRGCYDIHIDACEIEFKKQITLITGKVICGDSSCHKCVPSGRNKFCSDKCRWRYHGKKKREMRTTEGTCRQCGGAWLEPLETHRGKPDHCRKCQLYYQARHEKQKKPRG